MPMLVQLRRKESDADGKRGPDPARGPASPKRDLADQGPGPVKSTESKEQVRLMEVLSVLGDLPQSQASSPDSAAGQPIVRKFGYIDKGEPFSATVLTNPMPPPQTPPPKKLRQLESSQWLQSKKKKVKPFKLVDAQSSAAGAADQPTAPTFDYHEALHEAVLRDIVGTGATCSSSGSKAKFDDCIDLSQETQAIYPEDSCRAASQDACELALEDGTQPQFSAQRPRAS
eukprot:1042325-Pyramimonas_sp.AAC.1